MTVRLMRKRVFLTSSFLLLPAASPSSAGEVFERLSGVNQQSDQCFARHYGAAHMQGHPRQRVTRFQLQRDRGGPADVNNPSRFTVAIGLKIKDKAEAFVHMASAQRVVMGLSVWGKVTAEASASKSLIRTYASTSNDLNSKVAAQT